MVSDFEWWIIEQKTHLDIIELLQTQLKERPWCRYFLHENPLSPGNLNSTCRLEFVPFDRCVQDRFFYVNRSKNPEILAGSGITTQIFWDSNPESLPGGWQGAVRQSYIDSNTNNRRPNTQVALLVFTTKRFRGRGLSGLILSKMCITAKKRGYRYLIVPALPPTQFQKEYAKFSIEEIINLKRTDNQYLDYWIRLHTKMGADIIGHCAKSHRFAFTLEDFNKNVSSDSINSTGEHLLRLDRDSSLGPNKKNMWQLVYADVERSFVLFDWKCVWVQYDLYKLQFT